MDALVIFAVYPEAGKVKTRLAKDIGAKQAAAIYQSLLLDLIAEHQKQTYHAILCVTPAEKQQEFRALIKGALPLIPQHGKDLGERMGNCFRALVTIYQKTIIIGSDIPEITPTLVRRAFAALEKKDIILGPAVDGGYYLIGMKRPYDVFSGITWGVETVLEKTIEKITRQRLSYSLLQKRRDVDTREDLKALIPSLTKRKTLG